MGTIGLIKNLDGVLEVDGKTIIPLQHPAAVLHDISIKSTLVTNYRKMQVLYMRLSKKGLHAMRRNKVTHREAAICFCICLTGLSTRLCAIRSRIRIMRSASFPCSASGFTHLSTDLFFQLRLQ